MQTEIHDCGRQPKGVRIVRHIIDGRKCPWGMLFAVISGFARVSGDIEITHCPWCGEELG
jgi:hypothetical protein